MPSARIPRVEPSTSLGSPTLLLVPTELELGRLREHGGFQSGSCLVEICGFGPIAAAARTAELVARLRPSRVLLVGIAGAYEDAGLALGAALEFGEVAIDGVGAGEASRAIGPRDLDFPQWPARGERAPIFDRLALDSGAAARPLLLSVCAASDTRAMAAARRVRFPDAVAEDMEGFGVALACRLAGVPLRIVRGISNVAGDRDHARWRIGDALSAARELALDCLRGASEASARNES